MVLVSPSDKVPSINYQHLPVEDSKALVELGIKVQVEQ